MAVAIEFHTGVAEPLAFVLPLLHAAWAEGQRMLVTAPPPLLATLDRLLWTHDERSFVPHVRLPGAAAAVTARTPIWLAAQQAAAAERGDVPRLVFNIDADAPQDLAAIERLVEIVPDDPEALLRGRRRWRAYLEAGCKPVHRAAGATGG